MVKNKSASVERVRSALASFGLPNQVQELPTSTRTAVEAAQAVGSSVSQIVKSLVFSTTTGDPLLILTSGSNQVDEKKVSDWVGDAIHFANAGFVREQTGFAIGGVAPFGLKKQIPIYIDQDLLQHEWLWAAAGSAHAVFSISPQDLIEYTTGIVISVY